MYNILSAAGASIAKSGTVFQRHVGVRGKQATAGVPGVLK